MILMAFWHVSGVWKPLPRRAVPLALMAVLPSFLTVDYWNISPGCIFTSNVGKDDSLWVFWHAVEYIINNNNAHTQ